MEVSIVQLAKWRKRLEYRRLRDRIVAREKIREDGARGIESEDRVWRKKLCCCIVYSMTEQAGVIYHRIIPNDKESFLGRSSFSVIAVVVGVAVNGASAYLM